MFHILADKHRRYVLYYLNQTSDDVIHLEELVEQVATWHPDVSEEADADDQYQRVVIELHHKHLPALAETGIIDYDARSNTIKYWGLDHLEQHLDLAAEVELS